MPKFSIVIPAYNVEKYIERCVESVINQTFSDYELIVVNDGSTDKTIDLIRKYNPKIIESKHVSVSEARNKGAKVAKGEYLIFLDSDDYWDNELLEKVNQSLENNPDLVRFQVRTVTDNNEVTDFEEQEFNSLTGEEAFARIVNFHYIESIWCYAIKRSYYEKEKFKFKEGTIHEDFGLTPLIIIKSSKVNSISYIGYNYYRRSGSIMNTPDYEWTKRKVHDFYNHYLYLNKEINKVNVDRKIFKSFIANSMIIKITELNKKEYKEYKDKLKENKVYDNLLTDTLKRKIKKILFKISPKLGTKILKQKRS